MAFDGVVWSSATPNNANLVSEGDDFIVDVKLGVSKRMNREHVWPIEQTGTGDGGHHAYLTFQPQAAAPTFGGTTAGALYFSTAPQNAFIQDSAGTSYQVMKTGVGLFNPLIAKSWVTMSGVATAILLGGAGIASVARTGSGDYSVTFTNSLGDTNYMVQATPAGTTAARCVVINARSTGSFSFVVVNSANAVVDATRIDLIIFGTST